jgi:hypothetical protein
LVVLDLIESGTEAYHLILSPCPVVDRGYFCLDTDSALFQQKITSVKSDDALLIFSLSLLLLRVVSWISFSLARTAVVEGL